MQRPPRSPVLGRRLSSHSDGAEAHETVRRQNTATIPLTFLLQDDDEDDEGYYGQLDPVVFLMVPHAAWNHVRSFIALIAGMHFVEPDTCCTLLIPSCFQTLARIEMSHHLIDQNRIKIVHIPIGQDQPNHGYTTIPDFYSRQSMVYEQLQRIYPKVLAKEPVDDLITGKTIEPWPLSPNMTILDSALGGRAVRFCLRMNAASIIDERKRPKLICYSELSPHYFARTMTEDLHGPYGAFHQNCRYALDHRLQPDYEDLERYVYGSLEEVLKLHALLSSSDRDKQSGTVGPNLAREPSVERYLKDFSMFLHPNWPSFLGEDCCTCDRGNSFEPWSLSRRLHLFGPLLPPRHLDPPPDLDSHVGRFLETALREDGPRSVLYISFGTLFFAPPTHMLEAVLQLLHESGQRYILTRGNAPEHVQRMCKRKVRKSNGRGLYMLWAPQSGILSHPATMGFLCHGGLVSIMEGIRGGVPLIFWPGSGDQIHNATFFTQFVPIGITLEQIIYNPLFANKPRYSRFALAVKRELQHAIDTILGEEGDAMRNTMKRLTKKMEKEALKKGESYNALRFFADPSGTWKNEGQYN
ncbi:hypothetical protein M231_04410 [Tremella mesenterica]|uniref:Uncharacterized protein n=1 Tax=Tremella mesenterica TaxID=5217 RepID=A0A4Q1BKS5_TREME|nr:hypothetical protein M231_04410 [Tremella mesenterica]